MELIVFLLLIAVVFDLCELIDEVIRRRVCCEFDFVFVLVFVNAYAFAVVISIDILVLLLRFVITPKTALLNREKP